MSFFENIPELLDKAANVVAGASLIATVTGTKKDDSVIAWLRNIVNFLALNFGQVVNVKPTQAAVKATVEKAK